MFRSEQQWAVSISLGVVRVVRSPLNTHKKLGTIGACSTFQMEHPHGRVSEVFCFQRARGWAVHTRVSCFHIPVRSRFVSSILVEPVSDRHQRRDGLLRGTHIRLIESVVSD